MGREHLEGGQGRAGAARLRVLGEATHVGRIAEQAVGVAGAGLALVFAVLVAQLAVVGREVGAGRLVATAIVELEVEDIIGPGEQGVESRLDGIGGLFLGRGPQRAH